MKIQTVCFLSFYFYLDALYAYLFIFDPLMQIYQIGAIVLEIQFGVSHLYRISPIC